MTLKAVVCGAAVICALSSPIAAAAAEIEIVNQTPVRFGGPDLTAVVRDGAIDIMGGILPKTADGEQLLEVDFYYTFLDEAGDVLYVQKGRGHHYVGSMGGAVSGGTAAREVDAARVKRIIVTMHSLETAESRLAEEHRQQNKAKAKAEAIKQQEQKDERQRKDAERAVAERTRVAAEHTEKRRVEAIQAKRWAPEIERAVIERKIIIGMTAEQVQASVGKPRRVNETIRATGRSEQWIFESAYLYFENGRLTTIQTAR
jgi:hypothetical protein